MLPTIAAMMLSISLVANGTDQVVTAEQSPTWTEAESNRPKMTKAPSFVEGPRAELPESERAQGHHGPVVVQGIVGIDGKLREMRVKLKSGAPVVDEIALAAASASTFVPAKDANNIPLPVIISMPFDLVSYKSPQGMGILQYKCAQFVRDMDWWKSVNPDKSFKDHELYTMQIGLEMLSLIQRGKGDQAFTKQGIAEFGVKWIAAIDVCRKKPNMLQRDAVYR